jgi:hypothetical protein
MGIVSRAQIVKTFVYSNKFIFLPDHYFRAKLVYASTRCVIISEYRSSFALLRRAPFSGTFPATHDQHPP